MFIQIKLFSMVDLIRLVKLKKINGELDNLTDAEKLFISKFDLLNDKKKVVLFYSKYVIYSSKYKEIQFYYYDDFDMTVSYSMIDNIRSVHNMDYSTITLLIRDLFKKLTINCKHISFTSV